MKKIKILLTAVAMLLVVGVNAQTVNDVNTKYREAVQLAQDKKFQEAIPVLEEAMNMGLEVGDDALQVVQAMQKLLPQCYLLAGSSAAQAGNFTSAAEYALKAKDLSELYENVTILTSSQSLLSNIYTAMAMEPFNNKDYAKAAEIFEKGFNAVPTDTGLGLNLAMSYAEMGEYDKAFKVYKDIVALEGTHSKYKEPAEEARKKMVYYTMLRASESLEKNNPAEAVALLESFLEYDPANAQVNMMLIQTAGNMKNWAKVIEIGESVAAAQTDQDMKSEAYFLLGAAYQNTENKAKAIEAYRKVTSGAKAANAKTQIAALS